MSMRNLINRLNESESQMTADAIISEIDALRDKVYDQLLAIIKAEGIALSKSLPGYYVDISGGHGMTSIDIYPPLDIAAQIDADNDGAYGGATEAHDNLVQSISDYSSEKYFRGFKINDEVEKYFRNWSCTEFGILCFKDGKELSKSELENYISKLSKWVVDNSKHYKRY